MRNLAEILLDKYGNCSGWSVSIDYDEQTKECKQKTIEEQYEKLDWGVKGVDKPTLESLLKLSKKPSKKMDNICSPRKKNKLVRLIKFIVKYGIIIAAVIAVQKLITMV